MNDFRVDVGSYSGPLDLLLYLAKVNEVDVTDIPIAVITEQYIHYLDLMGMLNIELGSEFLVMASTLMEIKSRTLVPSDDIEEEEDIEDPRLELIQQLIEYRKVKEAAKDLNVRADRQSMKFPRTVKKTVMEEGYSLETIDLWDLVASFDKLMKQVSMPTSRDIVDDDVPIKVYIERVVKKLKESSPIAFEALFEGVREKATLIGTFLALLELARRCQLTVEQEGQFGQIRVGYVADQEAPAGGP